MDRIGVLAGQPVTTTQEFYYYRRSLNAATTHNLTQGRRTLVRGVWINANLAFPVEIRDNTTVVMILPAGTLAGTWCPLGDVAFTGGVSIANNASETGNITVILKAME
jgi:hypothetical protein